MYEISRALAAEGTPLNRTGVGEILAEEGFGRLVRGPEPDVSVNPATTGRDTRLPAARVIDFAAFPDRFDTQLAGLLLVVPDLVAFDLPAWWPRPATPARTPSPPFAGCCPARAQAHPHPPPAPSAPAAC